MQIINMFRPFALHAGPHLSSVAQTLPTTDETAQWNSPNLLHIQD